MVTSLLLLIILVLAPACARTVPLQEARFSANGQIYKHCLTMNIKTPTPNLIIVRDEGSGPLNPHVIHIDGEPCADLMEGEKLSMALPVGSYIVGTKNKWDPFSIGRLIETSVMIKEDKLTIVREGANSDGSHTINVSGK